MTSGSATRQHAHNVLAQQRLEEQQARRKRTITRSIGPSSTTRMGAWCGRSWF